MATHEVSPPRAFTNRGPFNFSPPDRFSGKKEDWEEFAFKLKAYLGLMEPKYFEELQVVEDHVDVELLDDMFRDETGAPREEIQQRALHLQWILVSMCGGPASTQLRRETTKNGYESYRQLCKRHTVPGRARDVGILTKNSKPSFAGGFEDALSAWEEEIL